MYRNIIDEIVKGQALESRMFDGFFAQFEENDFEQEPTLPEDGDNDTIEESIQESIEEREDKIWEEMEEEENSLGKKESDFDKEHDEIDNIQ